MSEESAQKLAVLLHADVVGSTDLVRLDETAAHRRIRDAFQRFSEVIREHNGTTHEIRGDALVADFPKASDAVTAALVFQAINLEHNNTLDDQVQPILRIGISIGEVLIADNTVTGEGIVLAQRLEQLAEPGGVCIQGAVYETLPKRLPFVFESLGERKLKGFDEPVKSYNVKQASVTDFTGKQTSSAPELVEKPSIAVLPLENMSGDSEQEFFADGITEDIITALSCNSSLLVIARNSSFAYKGIPTNIKKIGAELNAHYVLEGSIRKSASRVRVTAQLIDTASGSHLWAQRYDRVLEDIFELQDDITQMIVAAIQPELEVAERNRAHNKSPTNLSSWETFQRGMWHGYKMNSEDFTAAEACFQQVLNSDPEYAPALAGLGWMAYLRLLLNFKTDDLQSLQAIFESGLKHAAEAVAFNDKDAFAQYVYGRLLVQNSRFDEAIERLERAIEINPNYALAYYGLGFTLAMSGKPTAAIGQFDIALRLSPKDPFRWAFNTMRGYSYLQLKQYDAAYECAKRGVLDNEGQFWPYVTVASALGHLGRIEEAKKFFKILLQLKPDFSTATIDEMLRFGNSEHREHLLSGLVRAGLKE